MQQIKSLKNQNGFVEYIFVGIIGILLVLLIAVPLFVRWQSSDENVSGIVYNTKNNSFLSGNTTFSIRAGENTPVTDENQSSYCLPPNSPYIALVNKAAADKRIKVNVTATRYFALQAPWACYPNVKVTEVQ